MSFWPLILKTSLGCFLSIHVNVNDIHVNGGQFEKYWADVFQVYFQVYSDTCLKRIPTCRIIASASV